MNMCMCMCMQLAAGLIEAELAAGEGFFDLVDANPPRAPTEAVSSLLVEGVRLYLRGVVELYRAWNIWKLEIYIVRHR